MRKSRCPQRRAPPPSYAIVAASSRMRVGCHEGQGVGGELALCALRGQGRQPIRAPAPVESGVGDADGSHGWMSGTRPPADPRHGGARGFCWDHRTTPFALTCVHLASASGKHTHSCTSGVRDSRRAHRTHVHALLPLARSSHPCTVNRAFVVATRRAVKKSELLSVSQTSHKLSVRVRGSDIRGYWQTLPQVTHQRRIGAANHAGHDGATSHARGLS